MRIPAGTKPRGANTAAFPVVLWLRSFAPVMPALAGKGKLHVQLSSLLRNGAAKSSPVPNHFFTESL